MVGYKNPFKVICFGGIKMPNLEFDHKFEILQEAEKYVNEIHSARLNPTQSITGESARMWGIIEKWGLDQDPKLLKPENKGYFTTIIGMILDSEKEAIKMCINTMSNSSKRNDKWETIAFKFLEAKALSKEKK